MTIKKVLVSLALLVAASTVSFAQQDDFYPGWQFSVQAGAGYTAGHASVGDLISAPFAALSAGYNFTPVFTLRAGVSGYQSKGSIAHSLYKYNFGQVNADALFDVCNMFDYRYDRLLNPYVLAGFGGNVRFNNEEAAGMYSSFPAENYIWENPVLSLAGRLGAGMDVRLTDAVKFSLELCQNFLSDQYNSQKYDNGKLALDYRLDAMLGVKLTLDQATQRAKAVAAAAAAAAAKAAADKLAAEKAAAEKAAAQKAAAEKAAAEKAAAEAAAAAAQADREAAEAAKRAAERASSNGIYYTIGQTSIRKSELSVLDAVVEKLNAYPEAVVEVRGYADKETGSARRNMQLSKERANGVAKALMDKGVAAERIVVNYFGDTARISDVPAQNRAAVCETK